MDGRPLMSGHGSVLLEPPDSVPRLVRKCVTRAGSQSDKHMVGKNNKKPYGEQDTGHVFATRRWAAAMTCVCVLTLLAQKKTVH